MGSILIITGAVAFIVALVLFRALVLTYLWAWFVTPLGLPEIGMAHAIGLSLLIHILTQEYRKPSDNTDNPFLPMFTAFAVILFAWGLGAVARAFM